MAFLTHTQTRRISPIGFQVESVVTNAVEIPPEVFVFRSENDVFSHVASAWDLETIPVEKTPEVGYYRQSQVVRDFEKVIEAIDFGHMVKGRLKRLVSDYTRAQDAFVGSETERVTV